MNFSFFTLAGFTQWMTIHNQLAYLVLFLGAYFETLAGPAFFLPGEIFFIAGSLLAGAHILNVWLVALSFYTGGILGDSSSYWMGRKLGASIFKPGRKVFNPEKYESGQKFFEKHGKKAIFFARLLGPLSWITPFLAGTYEVPYSTFLLYNIPGVIVGIGEFLVAGYFFGDQYAAIFSVIQHYTLYSVLVISVIVAAIWYFRKRSNAKKAAKEARRKSEESIDVIS